MTTTTMNALSSSHLSMAFRSAGKAQARRFNTAAAMRAISALQSKLPEAPDVLGGFDSMIGRFALAMVPFGAAAWLFLAH